MAERDTTLTYRPALDGVRAIAVTVVLLYHANVSWMRGGFLGVDIFFVLSGYLITSLLLAEWRVWHHIDLLAFYRRRARRLLPALFVVVGAVAVWTWLEASPETMQQTRDDGIATLLYVANWRFVFTDQSYFAQYADPSPFRHMWSLGIEEQFYFLFPLLLLGLLALTHGRRIATAAVLGIAAVASAMLMWVLYTPDVDPSRVYYGTDTRIQELLVGAVLAVLIARLPRRDSRGTNAVTSVLSFTAIGLVLAACWHYTDGTDFLYRSGFLAFAVACAVLLLLIEIWPRNWAARALSLPPVVWVGVISYGLYLWHWPIFIALSPARTDLEGNQLLALRLAVTVAVAAASYFAVERPIRRGALSKLRPVPRRIAAIAVLPVTVVVLFAATTAAAPAPLAESPFPTTLTKGDGELKVLVVGDSVGFSLASRFPDAQYPEVTLSASNELGCGLAHQQLDFDGEAGLENRACRDRFDRWASAVAASDPDVVVLNFGAWEVFDHIIDDKVIKIGSQAYDEYLTQQLEHAVDVLTAGGARVLIPNVPCYRQSSAEVGGHDLSEARNDLSRGQIVNNITTRFAAAHREDVQVVDIASRLCPTGVYVDAVNDVQMRYDGLHFTDAGAATVWGWLMPAVKNASGQEPVALMIGDSVPHGLANFTDDESVPGMRVAISNWLGCGLFPEPRVIRGDEQVEPDGCEAWFDRLPSQIAAAAPEVVVIFPGIGEQFDRLTDDDVVMFGSQEFDDWLTGRLDQVVAAAESTGAAVALSTVPCHKVVDAGVTAGPEIVNDAERLADLNTLIRSYADSHDRIDLIDLDEKLCADGYSNTVDDIELRSDGLHFTEAGAGYVWDYLGPRIAVLAEPAE